jgi:hypothetical protein
VDIKDLETIDITTKTTTHSNIIINKDSTTIMALVIENILIEIKTTEAGQEKELKDKTIKIKALQEIC